MTAMSVVVEPGQFLVDFSLVVDFVLVLSFFSFFIILHSLRSLASLFLSLVRPLLLYTTSCYD
jgi:hypothetical protein